VCRHLPFGAGKRAVLLAIPAVGIFKLTGLVRNGLDHTLMLAGRSRRIKPRHTTNSEWQQQISHAGFDPRKKRKGGEGRGGFPQTKNAMRGLTTAPWKCRSRWIATSRRDEAIHAASRHLIRKNQPHATQPGGRALRLFQVTEFFPFPIGPRSGFSGLNVEYYPSVSP